MTAAGSFGLTGYGFASALDMPGVRRLTMKLPSLPSEWHGLRILQISDVHAGPYMGRRDGWPESKTSRPDCRRT